MANKQFHPEVTAIKRRSLSAPVAWLVRHHYFRSGQSNFMKLHENSKFAIYHATEYDVTRYLHEMGIFGDIKEG